MSMQKIKSGTVRRKSLITKNTTLHLGGKERTLIYDLNAYAELEDRFGTVEAATDALQGSSMKAVRTWLWAGIIHTETILDDNKEPIGYNVNEHEVGKWINSPKLLTEVIKAVASAISEAQLDDENKDTAIEADSDEDTQKVTVLDEDGEPVKNA